MLLLSSYERMRRYVSSQVGVALTDSMGLKQQFVGWIASASKQIETYLGRYLTIAAYTEYFDALTNKDYVLFVRGYPITMLTSVYQDGSSLWDGSESEVDDCFTGKNGDSIIMPIRPSTLGHKVLRTIYTGGLAYSGVKSIFTIASVAGTWTAGQIVAGGTSEAVGIVKASTATTLTVEVLYGVFEALETLTEYTDETLTTTGDASATLSAITQQSLVEQYPDIVRACEIQVRHYWKHKDDFELSSTSKDGTNLRGREYNDLAVLTPEAMSLLRPYRRLHT